MYRNPDDTIIGGVSSGLAAYLDTDAVVFRILFVLVTLFFGVGFFIYLGLWIALPVARTASQKREMYGNTINQERSYSENKVNVPDSGTTVINRGYNNTSRIGNAINEIFRAIGSVCFVILRIFLIIIGISFVITGFLIILSFVMVFLFKYPGTFAIDSSGINLIYVTDFLNYIVNPAIVPWIILLTSIAVILPLAAMVYWGVKMIFWFRARDGVVSLIALVVWVMTIAALSILLFNEGISFAETGKTTTETVLPHRPDTLYVTTDHKIADLKYDKEISLPHEEYNMFINDNLKELYIRPYLSIDMSDDKLVRLEVRKRSTGHNVSEAIRKTDGLLYNYRLRNDTLNLDEYFTITSGHKWSADNIGIHLYVPAGTVIKFDKDSRYLVHSFYHDGNEEYRQSHWQSDNECWVQTEEGLEPVFKKFRYPK